MRKQYHYVFSIRGTNDIAEVTACTAAEARAIASEHSGIPAARFRPLSEAAVR